jgi:hypothetical protein
MATYKISGLTSASAVIATNLFEISEVTVYTTVVVSVSASVTTSTTTTVSAFESRQATAAQIRSYTLAAISGYTLAKTSLTDVSATTTLDLATANYFSAEVSGSSTFVFANPPVSTVAAGFVLELVNGGTHTVGWPATVDWPSGVAPTLTDGGTDLLVFITDDGGTIWRGVLSMGDSK